MSLCVTKYFGAVEYDGSAVVRFPAGLPGFDLETDFLLLNIPAHEPLIFLQSVNTAELCFVALPVQVVDPAYQLDVAETDLMALGVDLEHQPAIGSDALCLALLTISESGVTANLLAPIVVDLRSRRAVQAVAPVPRYSHQHPVPEAGEAVCS